MELDMQPIIIVGCDMKTEGVWRYDDRYIETDVAGYNYYIERDNLDRAGDHPDDWIDHLMKKPWMTRLDIMMLHQIFYKLGYKVCPFMELIKKMNSVQSLKFGRCDEEDRFRGNVATG
jgi:hypothetical protein